MLHIKSAQYMQAPMPKPLPGEPQYEIEQCKLCGQDDMNDELRDGFCKECIRAGHVKKCVNCGTLIEENEAQNTDRGPMCPDCAESLFDMRGNFGKGRYIGPRDEYYSGPYENY